MNRNLVRINTTVAAVVAAGALLFTSTAPAHAQAPAKGPYGKVDAIFKKNCAFCHTGERARAGVDLSTYAGVIKGGREGAIVVKGKPDDSVLVWVLKASHGKRQMPPRTALPASDISVIEAWIKAGAKK